MHSTLLKTTPPSRFSLMIVRHFSSSPEFVAKDPWEEANPLEVMDKRYWCVGRTPVKLRNLETTDSSWWRSQHSKIRCKIKSPAFSIRNFERLILVRSLRRKEDLSGGSQVAQARFHGEGRNLVFFHLCFSLSSPKLSFKRWNAILMHWAMNDRFLFYKHWTSEVVT